MSAILPNFYIILLSGLVLSGLVLIVTGIVLLIKSKNKVAGALATAIGLVFTIFPIGIFLLFTATRIVRGGS